MMPITIGPCTRDGNLRTIAAILQVGTLETDEELILSTVFVGLA